MHVHQSQNWRTLLKAPATPSKTVAFKMSAGVSEREREKFLTAKYGAHQYCTVLYCTVLNCTVLYCTVLYCTVLY